MLKISVVDHKSERRMLIEGKLTAPWVAELRNAWKRAQICLEGRGLVVDFKNIMTISREGENFLLELLQSGTKVRCCGVYMRYLVKQLSRRTQRTSEETER